MPTAVIMPKFEMAQETGTVGRWLVEEGAAVAKGDAILEVETDKVTMDVESPAGGILAGITAAPGQVIPIGQTIAYILQPGRTPSGKPPPSRKSPLPGSPTSIPGKPPRPSPRGSPPPTTSTSPASPAPAPPAASLAPTSRRTWPTQAQPRPGDPQVPGHSRGDAPANPAAKPAAVPAARRLARELGVDLATVAGTGPNGRIQSADIHRAAQNTGAQTRPRNCLLSPSHCNSVAAPTHPSGHRTHQSPSPRSAAPPPNA